MAHSADSPDPLAPAPGSLTRRDWIAAAATALGGSSLAGLTGCGALQQLDTSAAGEGTGIQIVGAIMVLAKYRASPVQRTVAEQKSRRAFVDRGMRPALAAEKKKVRVRRERQVAAARKASYPTIAQKTAALVKLEHEATAELAHLESTWRSVAAEYTSGKYVADFVGAKPTTPVAFASVKDEQVLTASASYLPRYLAVSVPPEKSVAGAASSVMFWDARSHQLAKNDVYVVDRQPELGAVARFDDISAQFVER